MTATPGALPATVGQTIAGKYYIERAIGAGGMGMVFLARHTVLGSWVALKFMHSELVTNPEMRARFRGEAERGAQLQSEHVARVLDVGELPDGLPFIVMEYVEGQDLGSVLRERGPLPVKEAVDCLLQACEGIAEAHSRRIVHRDIKPANLIVSRRHDRTILVKVLDFGIAKTLSNVVGEAGKLTKTYTVMGSPYYSAPEQLESASYADERSDIWALGVTLYELLTAKGPFEGGSHASLIAAVMTKAPIPVRHCRPDLPEDLEWIIQRCLEKDPNRRFSRVADLTERLAPHGTREAVRSTTRISGIPGQERTNTVAVPPPEVPWQAEPALSPERKPVRTVAFSQSAPSGARTGIIVVAAVGFVLLAAGGVAAFFLATSAGEPPPLPLPPPAATPAPLRIPAH